MVPLKLLLTAVAFVALTAGPTAVSALAEPPAKTEPAKDTPKDTAKDAAKDTAKKDDAKDAPKAPAIDPARLAAARKLIEVTGTAKQFDGAMAKVITSMQQQFERRAPKHKKEIGEVMAPLAEKYAARKGELLEKVIAYYATTLAPEDLEAVTKFFSEDAGQRYIAAVPSLAEGTSALAKEWGRTIGESIRRDVEAEFKKRKIPM